MKRVFISIIVLSLLFVSCASKPNEQNNSKEVTSLPKETEKVCPFDDWKYMGFGQELPEWVEVLLSNELPEIKTTHYYMLFPDITLKDIMTIDISEDTLDLSESRLQAKIQTNPEYILFQTFWVRTKIDQQYHSVALLYK